MRALSFLAFALLGIAALGVVPAQFACEPLVAGFCGDLGWIALLVLVGFCGVVLLLSALVVGIVRTSKRQQWAWLVGLCVGTLAAPVVLELLASLLLTILYNGPSELQQSLPTALALLLSPVTVLVYSARYPPTPRMSVAT
jgi:hypothetical protein